MGPHALDPSAALKRCNRVLEHELDAVLSVDISEDLPDRLAHDPCQRRPEALDGGHLNAQLAQGGRHLGAYEAHADNDCLAAGRGASADHVRLIHGTQLEDPLELETRNRWAAIAAARRHEEPVVRQARPAVQLDLPGPGVDP